MLKLSLVIPCYNEADNLPLLLPKCAEVVKGGDVEVILVDNGSTDDTPALLAQLLPRYPGCRSVRVPENRGYGHGILRGLDAAEGNVLGWTHADMQTDPEDARRGLALFTRYGEGIFVKGHRSGRPLGDVLFTVGMSVFESVLLQQPMWDINAQPTMFGRAFMKAWTDPPDDFALDLYAYCQAKRLALPVHRIAVRFGKRARGVSHWNVNWAAKRKFVRRTVDFSLQLRKALKP